MTEHLQWGIISAARINRKLIPAIRATERADVIAVASRSPSRAIDYAAAWNLPRSYGSYETLLDDADVMGPLWSCRSPTAGRRLPRWQPSMNRRDGESP